MEQISASIALYNNPGSLVLKAVRSFLNTDLAVKLYLVDNSSNNDLSELNRFDKRLEYIYSGANLGYGKAHNMAMQKAIAGGAKYHLVLNPDVYFETGTIEKLFEFMESNRDVGMVMPKITYPDGSLQYLCKLLPAPSDLIFRRFMPLRFLSESINYTYELRFSDHDKMMDIPCLSGCFMFIRTEALKQVGFFDERYFMYMEDTDLSRRFHRFCRTVYYPEAVACHEYEKGSYYNLICLKHHLESAIKYFNKWGWFFDDERKKINSKALERLGYFDR